MEINWEIMKLWIKMITTKIKITMKMKMKRNKIFKSKFKTNNIIKMLLAIFRNSMAILLKKVQVAHKILSLSTIFMMETIQVMEITSITLIIWILKILETMWVGDNLKMQIIWKMYVHNWTFKRTLNLKIKAKFRIQILQ